MRVCWRMDITSVVNSGSDLLIIELEDSGTYIDHKSHILLFNKYLIFLLRVLS